MFESRKLMRAWPALVLAAGLAGPVAGAQAGWTTVGSLPSDRALRVAGQPDGTIGVLDSAGQTTNHAIEFRSISPAGKVTAPSAVGATPTSRIAPSGGTPEQFISAVGLFAGPSDHFGALVGAIPQGAGSTDREIRAYTVDAAGSAWSESSHFTAPEADYGNALLAAGGVFVPLGYGQGVFRLGQAAAFAPGQPSDFGGNRVCTNNVDAPVLGQDVPTGALWALWAATSAPGGSCDDAWARMFDPATGAPTGTPVKLPRSAKAHLYESADAASTAGGLVAAVPMTFGQGKGGTFARNDAFELWRVGTTSRLLVHASHARSLLAIGGTVAVATPKGGVFAGTLAADLGHNPARRRWVMIVRAAKGLREPKVSYLPLPRLASPVAATIAGGKVALFAQTNSTLYVTRVSP